MHLLLALPYHYFRLWIAGPSIFAPMPSGSVQILCGTYLLEFVLLGTVPQPTLPLPSQHHRPPQQWNSEPLLNSDTYSFWCNCLWGFHGGFSQQRIGFRSTACRCSYFLYVTVEVEETLFCCRDYDLNLLHMYTSLCIHFKKKITEARRI
jgi:hypothetical protein